MTCTEDGCEAQRLVAARMRDAAVRGKTCVTGDPATEIYVISMLGAGYTFGDIKDYRTALDWAVRAYRAGAAGQGLADVVNATGLRSQAASQRRGRRGAPPSA